MLRLTDGNVYHSSIKQSKDLLKARMAEQEQKGDVVDKMYKPIFSR